jgi:hypothetical protein
MVYNWKTSQRRLHWKNLPQFQSGQKLFLIASTGNYNVDGAEDVKAKRKPQKNSMFFGVFWHTCRDSFFAHRVSKAAHSAAFSLCDEKAGRGKSHTVAFSIRGFESL